MSHEDEDRVWEVDRVTDTPEEEEGDLFCDICGAHVGKKYLIKHSAWHEDMGQ